MNNYNLYQSICEEISQLVTERYSTSFSKSVSLLDSSIRNHIYNIYGFVRLADEIVDTFHPHNQQKILDRFIASYREDLEEGISINPIIQAFCETQRKFNIPQHLVDAFLQSMEMDLGKMETLNKLEYDTYIYGSAEVVGLMCLMIFVKGDNQKYEQLKPSAKRLGAALQKVNFLRDMNADFHILNRTYFPNVEFNHFTEKDKQLIEKDIEEDFKVALKGIKDLPITSRYAVYLAYKYYHRLFLKIKAKPASALFNQRMRINNFQKMMIYSKILVYKNLKLQSQLS
ncbi:MAG: phytoene/squalene synthase family protein [Weeksellaceae bacterium]